MQISDIFYNTNGCGYQQGSETRPKDPAADSNSQNIYQCTGKRTCVVPEDHIKRPFQPKRLSTCRDSTSYKIHVSYSCVPQGLNSIIYCVDHNAKGVGTSLKMFLAYVMAVEFESIKITFSSL